MERHSLPLAYYLNNDEPDKTGYQQMALSAFYKAVNFHPSKNCVTIGPKPQASDENVIQDSDDPNNKSLENDATNTQETEVLTKEVSDNSLSKSEILCDYKDKLSQTDEDLLLSEKLINESLEEKEEKLIRRRILTSLENICLLESQAKVNIMRREWMKRDKETMTRLQEELNNTTSMLEEKMLDNFYDRQILLDDVTKRSPEPEKIDKPVVGQSAVFDAGKNNSNDITFPVSKNSNAAMSFAAKDSLPSVLPKDNILSSPKPVTTTVNGIDVLKPKDALSTFSFQIPSQNKSVAFTPPTSSTNLEPENTKENITDPNLGKDDSKSEKVVSRNELPMESENLKPEKPSSEPQKPTEKEEDKKNSGDDITSMEEDIIVEGKKEPEKAKEIDPEVVRVQNVMKHYQKYKKIHTEAAIALKGFLTDDSLKKFRSDCQKAVNVPVNAISGVSAAHLTDKLNKLSGLLAGNSVLVSNKSFSPSQHPLGVLYCHFLLAEKIVRQGEDAVSVKSDSAFPIALLALEMWRQFPKFGDLLIGAFHKVCPYLIPIYWIKEDGMSNEEYDRLLGFKYSGGERENIDMFLKRQGGVVRLYFSIVISHMKGNQNTHPLPLSEAWRWLAMFTGLEPSAEITATLLYDMLEVTGHSMLKTYGKQFLKLIHLICVHFIPKIEKVTPKGKGGPVSRLKSFLEQLIRTQNIKPPKGILPANFW